MKTKAKAKAKAKELPEWEVECIHNQTSRVTFTMCAATAQEIEDWIDENGCPDDADYDPVDGEVIFNGAVKVTKSRRAK